jgi:tetratricopeptide (TPR) repeat protein
MKKLAIYIICFSFSIAALANQPEYKNLLREGVSLYRQSEFSDAVSVLLKSYELNNNSFSAYYLALSHYYLGQNLKAVIYSNEALKSDPEIGLDKRKILEDLIEKVRNDALSKVVESNIDREIFMVSQFSTTDANTKDLEKLQALYLKEKNRKEIENIEEMKILNALGVTPQDIEIYTLLEKSQVTGKKQLYENWPANRQQFNLD